MREQNFRDSISMLFRVIIVMQQSGFGKDGLNFELNIIKVSSSKKLEINRNGDFIWIY